jgi:hypothetical protein
VLAFGILYHFLLSSPVVFKPTNLEAMLAGTHHFFADDKNFEESPSPQVSAVTAFIIKIIITIKVSLQYRHSEVTKISHVPP